MVKLLIIIFEHLLWNLGSPILIVTEFMENGSLDGYLKVSW